MKKEKQILLITMLLNLLVAIVKLISGLILGFSTLVADSLQSFADFITDIISNIANRIGKKRATKKYPFGYGMIENISNFIIGIILLLLALFILITSFKPHEVEITPIIFMILIITILLKLAIIYLLNYYGNKLNSSTLLASLKESTIDLLASIIVLIVSFLLIFQDQYPFLKYSNTIGSILISLITFYLSISIMIENIRYLLGVNEDNEEIINELTAIIVQNKLIKDSSIKLMKIGTYYNLYLTIELETNITLKQLFNLEKKLKKQIKHANLHIKFIEIEPREYD